MKRVTQPLRNSSIIEIRGRTNMQPNFISIIIRPPISNQLSKTRARLIFL